MCETHHSLANINKYSPSDEHIEEMEALLKNTALNSIDKMHLSFGLARAYENTNQFEKSFQYLVKGNALIRSAKEYSTANSGYIFTQIKQFFDGLPDTSLTQKNNMMCCRFSSLECHGQAQAR